MNAHNFVPTEEIKTYEEFLQIRDNCRKETLHDQISLLRRAVREADRIDQFEFDFNMSDAAIEKHEQEENKAMRGLRLVYNAICDEAKNEILNIKVASLNLQKYIKRECSSIGDYYSMESFEYLVGDDDLEFPDLMDFMYDELERYINENNMHNAISLPTGETTKEWMLAYRSDTKSVDKLPFDDLSFDNLVIGVMGQFIIAKENYFNHLYGMEQNRAKLELEKVKSLISDAILGNGKDGSDEDDNALDDECDADGSSTSKESIEMNQGETLEDESFEEPNQIEAVEQSMEEKAVKECLEYSAAEELMETIADGKPVSIICVEKPSNEELIEVDGIGKNVVPNEVNELQSKPNPEISIIVISDDSEDEI